jgi:hypothetical protein
VLVVVGTSNNTPVVTSFLFYFSGASKKPYESNQSEIKGLFGCGFAAL